MQKIAFLLILFLATGTLHAAEPVLLDGVNIAPAVAYFEGQVRTLSRPIPIYNWSTNAHLLPGGDIGGWIRRSVGVFWNGYGNPTGPENTYGSGFYGAEDPVVSFAYGGGGDQWLLTRLTLPPGFRLIDIGRLGGAGPVPEDVLEILQKFNCDGQDLAKFGWMEFFYQWGSSLSDRCRSFGKSLFMQYVPIDGFAYSYFAMSFHACPASLEDEKNLLSNRAFVITNDRWIRPEHFRAFNKDSRDFLEDRRRIQTLFAQAQDRFDFQSLPALKIQEQFKRDFPNRTHVGTYWQALCGDVECSVRYQAYDGSLGRSRQFVAGRYFVSPDLRIFGDLTLNLHRGGLLWADLKGQALSPNTDEWLRENILGCEKTREY